MVHSPKFPLKVMARLKAAWKNKVRDVLRPALQANKQSMLEDYPPRAALAAERDAYLRQRDEALGERNEYLRQRDVALGERNELRRQIDEAWGERNEFRRQRDVAIGERSSPRRPGGNALLDLIDSIDFADGQPGSVFTYAGLLDALNSRRGKGQPAEHVPVHPSGNSEPLLPDARPVRGRCEG
jgi:hypothetical protein